VKLIGIICILGVLVLSGCDASNTSSASGTSGTGTTGTPTSGSSPTTISSLDPQVSAFLTLINAYRVQNSAPALQVSIALTNSAQWMSTDMANNNYLDHTDSLGRDPYTRMIAFGYDYNTDEGENVAAGNSDASDTFTQWKNSAEHNANMLDASYLVIGIGRAYSATSTYGWYWTTDFGGYVDAVMSP
jgi:uncharacterized protein YkwD